MHDFGLFQFDSTELRFTPPTAIAVAPSELQLGFVNGFGCDHLEAWLVTIFFGFGYYGLMGYYTVDIVQLNIWSMKMDEA